MKIARLSCLTLLSLALFGCDQTAKKTLPTTAIKAREPVIGLALGGGGAKGFAHIGVIKVLESHGIKAKIVTGTSAGSFVGSIYASGQTPYQMQNLALKLQESDLRDLTLNSQGFIAGQKLQNYVNAQVGNKPIEQFPKRFAAVATRLDNGKKAVFLVDMKYKNKKEIIISIMDVYKNPADYSPYEDRTVYREVINTFRRPVAYLKALQRGLEAFDQTKTSGIY